MNYQLDAARNVIPGKGLGDWSMWIVAHQQECRVGYEVIGSATVSTMFLGVAPNEGSGEAPLVFETMVFMPESTRQQRYATWAEAEAGHAEMVASVRRLAKYAEGRVFPIAEIKARAADPEVAKRAEERMRKVNERAAPHIEKMEALGAQAIRAKSPAAKVRALREMLDLLHSAADGIAACGKGCTACCHTSVLMGTEEAAVIGAEIGVKPASPARFLRQGDRDRTAIHHYGEACPFLVNDQCSIYASRPLACRTLYNMDSDALLCTIIPDDPPSVPYLNHWPFTMVIAQAFIHAIDHHADLREFFPKGKSK